MKMQLTRMAERAGERWRAERRLLEGWVLVTAGLLIVIAAFCVAAVSFSATLLTVAIGVFATGVAAGILAAFTIVSRKTRDKDQGTRDEP